MTHDLNITAISMFAAFVALTLGITYWAAKRVTGTKNFYSAGGSITGFQNGLRLPEITCLRPRFWGFQDWCFPRVMTG